MKSIGRKLQDLAINGIGTLGLPCTLEIKTGRAGFFAEVFMTLNGIRLAERYGLRAKVIWGEASPYFDHIARSNAWTEFFENDTFDFSKSKRRLMPVIPYRPGAHHFVPYEDLTVRKSVSQAIGNWCRPRPDITKRADDLIKSSRAGDKRVLGVHIRRTDTIPGHDMRRSVDVTSFENAIDERLSQNQFDTIYLATDDQEIADQFKLKYKDRVKLQPCMRSQDGNSIHGHYDQGTEGDPTEKGREVLIDAIVLANCDFLIRTHSSVTLYSLCLNPELKFLDLEKELLRSNLTPWLH